MRLFGVWVAVLALAVFGLAQSPSEVGLDHVLELLRAVPVEQTLRQATASALRDAVPAGRASPQVVYRYLEHVRELPSVDAATALEILQMGLQQGLLMDRLLNEALKGWAMSRSWDDILDVLELRLKLLLSAQDAVTGLRMGLHVTVEICPTTLRHVVLEIGWAVGDYIVQGGSPADTAGMTTRVRERLTRLRGAAPCERTVDAWLEALTPELVPGIVAGAPAQEGR